VAYQLPLVGQPPTAAGLHDRAIWPALVRVIVNTSPVGEAVAVTV
jgi:hypothetical protein